MKNWKLPVVLMACMLFILNSCTEDECLREMRFIRYTPVYMTLDEIQNIRTDSPMALERPGKIYFYNNYIFVNEINKGIHVIDSSNPANPTNISFIHIPGNRDMAVQGQYLYADNGADLVTLDISTPIDVQVVDRKQEAFKPIHEYTNGYLVYYEEEEVTEIVDCNSSDFNTWGGNLGLEGVVFTSYVSANSSAGGTTPSGVGGSMARFTLSSGHLYAVNDFALKVFDLAAPESPNPVHDVNIGWGIETIFPYQDKLFVGSTSGMFIFENSNPSSPYQLSSFQHAQACDPVFVKDNYAYVTLRSGTWCEGFSNQLDLIDITDLRNPVLEETFQMDNPHGLSIKDESLYLCEGEFGLKTFDISDPTKLGNRRIERIKDIHAYDAINVPNSDVLLVIGEDGLYQYDASNPSNLKEISKIEVVR